MVQILPQQTNIGNQLGQALGQGVGGGAQMGMQRGMLQNALKGLTNLPENANAFDLAKELISSTAGIPGAERYVGQLFPLLLNQMRGKQVGLNTQGGGPRSQGSMGSHGEGQTGPEGAGAIGAGGQFQRQGGYLTPPMNAEEMNSFAQNYALGDPSRLAEGYQIAQKQNEAAENSISQIQQRAAASGVTEKEMPYFMQIAQQSGEKNPEKLLPQAMRDLEQIRALDNALVPGITRGIIKTGMPFGLLPALLAGGRTREEAVRGIKPTIDQLVKKGFEPIVRDKLAKMDLSRTEVEDLIHPLSKETAHQIISLPKASSTNLEHNERSLESFFEKNVKPGTSLLVLRDKLAKEKGYDWQQINKAFQKAVDKGLPLTNSQATELTEFTSQPPRDSLMNIFADWGRPIDWLKGRK